MAIFGGEEASREFFINDYLYVKLINGWTEIFVRGKYMWYCNRLLLNISKKKTEASDHIWTSDEASTYLKSTKDYHPDLTPETRFWATCSNLQVWAENNYDTRLLHRSLSFSLLRELYKAGDPLAINKYKEEIALRILAGYEPVIEYLIEEGYLAAFSTEELEVIREDINSHLPHPLDMLERYLEYRNDSLELDIELLRFILNFLLHVKVGTYKTKDLKTRDIPIYCIIHILNFIQDNPEHQLVSRSGIQIRITSPKRFEVVASPLYGVFSLTQRMVLYFYSARNKHRYIHTRWMCDELQRQMGKLFYRIAWLDDELTPDGIYMGKKLEEIINNVLKGIISLETATQKIQDHHTFLRTHKFPLPSKSYDVQSPLEFFGMWCYSLNKYLGLE